MKLLKYILNHSGYEQFGVLVGYLRASGWVRSFFSKIPVGRNGEPIPWYNYSFMHFLNTQMERLGKEYVNNLKVFEFGSGQSTIWWATKVSQVVSVEDNNRWYSYVVQKKAANVTCKFAADTQSYVDALLNEKGWFDIIIIDGSHRQLCIEKCSHRLSETGVIIVDNSDCDSLKSALVLLERQGFKQLEFYGLGPVNGHPWGTSVFYRHNNLLGI